MKTHEPKSNSPELLSLEKRNWCSSDWEGRTLKQTKVMVFQSVMNTTPRPTSPNETIGYGYMRSNKFHDREPEAIVKNILIHDPSYFDNYPRKPGTKLDTEFMKSIVGELAKSFYRYGLSAYGKPGLRKDDVALEAI